MVVATRAEEDGLASARLVGSLLGSGAGELELVAELGAHHWRSGRLEEVLGSRTLGRGHHWELVGHLHKGLMKEPITKIYHRFTVKHDLPCVTFISSVLFYPQIGRVGL